MLLKNDFKHGERKLCQITDNADRFQAAFLGAAVGDALAAPAQGRKPGWIVQKFGVISDFLDPDVAFADQPRKRRHAGACSLPAQQMLLAAESLLLASGFDLADLARTLLSASGSEGGDVAFLRGHDPALKLALGKAPESADPLDWGAPHPGMSAWPRVLPAALFFRDQPPVLTTAAIESVLVTHNDPRSVAGAAALAFVVASMACHPGLIQDYRQFIRLLARDVRKAEEHYQDYYGRHIPAGLPSCVLYAVSDALQILPACLTEKDRDLVMRTLIQEADRFAPPHPVNHANQDFAVSGILFLLHTALSAPDFGRGLLGVINEGREASLMGCLAGFLLGLRFGMDAIPEEWISGLLNAEQYALRGREFSEGCPDWSLREDLVSIEMRLTRAERAEHADSLEEKKRVEEKRSRKRENHIKKTSPAPNVPSQEEALFAPPPELFLNDDYPDPIKAKRDKALRGRRRIDWKEDRRRGQKQKAPEDLGSEDLGSD